MNILQVCLEEEDHVGIHIYLEDIIIMKREEKNIRLIKIKCKDGFKIDQHTKLEDVLMRSLISLVW